MRDWYEERILYWSRLLSKSFVFATSFGSPFFFFFEGGVVNDETTRHLFVWKFVLFVFWRGFYSFQQTKRFSLLITCKGCINTSDSTKTTKRKGGTFLKRKKAFFWEERGKGEEGKEE